MAAGTKAPAYEALKPVGEDGGVAIKPSRFKIRHWPVWRRNTLIGAVATLVVLILNVVALAVGQAHAGHFSDAVLESSRNGTIVLATAPCNRANDLSVLLHLVINVLGTVLLSASAACMQCLGAPSREDVDRAHGKGVSLHIGLLSLTNLRHVSWKRGCLWVLLGLTSLVFHVLYNSVIFTSSTTTQTLAALTYADPQSPLITDLVQWDRYLDTDFPPAIETLSAALGSDKLRSMAYDDCQQEALRLENRRYSNMLLVSTLAADGNLSSDFGEPGLDGTSVPDNSSLLLAVTATDPRDFQLIWAEFCPGGQSYDILPKNFFRDCGYDGAGEPYNNSRNYTIDHCLALPFEPTCLVEFDPTLMKIVIVANALKIAIMLCVVFLVELNPLVTVGDAIASFLRNPDPVTTGLGIVSSGAMAVLRSSRGKRKRKIDRHVDADGCRTSGKTFVQHTYLWWHSVSKRRWVLTLVPWTAGIVAGIAVLGDVANAGDLSLVWNDWSHVTAGRFILTKIDTFAGNVVLANTPQLLLSFYYFVFTSLITTMLVSAEFTDFIAERKALRVSSPAGRQRSTYYLQIPFRYAVPLTVLSVALHWLLSQSLFAVFIGVYDIDGQGGPDAGFANNRVDGSVIGIVRCDAALLVLLLCAILMLVGIVLLARLRKFRSGSVLVAHDSLAISAAAHPQPGEPADASELPLQYGVLLSKGPSGYHRVGFSSEEVGPLVDGEVYDCVYELERLDMLWYKNKGEASKTSTRGYSRTREEDDDRDYI